MKKLIHLVVLLSLVVSAQAFAQTTKPSQESLNKLFVITDVEAMIQKLQGQLDGMMNTMMQELIKGRAVTVEQQKALVIFRAKVAQIQKDEINWEVLEPKISEIYHANLSQEDVDGIVAFYQTPAGQSLIKKMPQVMQQTMVMMQSSMVPMIKKIDAAGLELKQDLQRIEQK